MKFNILQFKIYNVEVEADNMTEALLKTKIKLSENSHDRFLINTSPPFVIPEDEIKHYIEKYQREQVENFIECQVQKNTAN